MDGPKRQRLESSTNDVDDPLNLSLSAAKVEYRSPGYDLTEMRSRYQQWVLENYRDSSKTKTITAKKYDRIIKTLAGEIKNCAENSKFRFWMKCKGFKLDAQNEEDTRLLLVQDKKDEEIKYKKVAIVENFFDIIYDVHVNEGARGIKHAGQKRTHRMITETYAFLPREAVTKFLLCCIDCQKRLNDDRKPSPSSSSCDSTQPQPIDLHDFPTLPPATLDRAIFAPTSPTISTTAYPCDRDLALSDSHDDLTAQPYDYSSQLSPICLTTDAIRKQRKRKVTRKIIRPAIESEINDSVLNRCTNSSSIFSNRAGEQRIPSPKTVQQLPKMNFLDSRGCAFVENANKCPNVAENTAPCEEKYRPSQFKCDTNVFSLERSCPFLEKISQVLYNPIKYAINNQRSNNSSATLNEDFLEQSAVDILLKARHLETMKDTLTENEREQILWQIYSCRINSFLLNYAADLMLKSMVDDHIS